MKALTVKEKIRRVKNLETETQLLRLREVLYQMEKRIENNKKRFITKDNKIADLLYKNRALALSNEKQRGKVKQLQLKYEQPGRRHRKLQIILKSIIAYETLKSGGYITFNEFSFLLIGAQKRVFSLDDVKKKYPDIKYGWLGDLKACVEIGFFRVVRGKDVFSITTAGDERLTAILENIVEPDIELPIPKIDVTPAGKKIIKNDE